LLPASASNPNKGRATQGSADALLAKVYAQQGKYDSSLIYCNKVLSSSYYSLAPNYADLFDGNHKNTAESIFEIQHSTVSGTSSYGPELLLPFSLTGDTYAKFNVVTNDLVAAFKAEGDAVRLNASVYFSIPSDTIAIPPPYTIKSASVPYAYKWKQPAGYASPDNEILIRLADIMLLKAEALNQTGQTAQAIPLINQVRARAQLANTTAVTQPDMATAILKERRLELALEGHRWMDLLRAGAPYTINLMNSQVDPSGSPLKYGVTQNKLLFPVPQSERDLDKNLSQNLGY
jgi:tetratricopeptide (TPR) repeat protein